MSSVSDEPASAHLEARLDTVEPARPAIWLFTLLWVVTLGWWGELPEPRHRVVVFRRGTSAGVGVVEAYTLTKAKERLAEVQAELDHLTVGEFRDRRDLEDVLTLG